MRGVWNLGIAKDSKNKDAAYLFIQWLNSEDVSRQRVQLPYTLRDPFRESHYTDPGYLALWPNAKDYLAALKQASETGLLDLSLLQTDKYEEVMRQAISKLWAGDDPKTILDAAAAQRTGSRASTSLRRPSQSPLTSQTIEIGTAARLMPASPSPSNARPPYVHAPS